MTTDILRDRLAFLRIDEQICNDLRELKPLILAAMPAALDEFYGHLSHFPEMARMFPNAAVKEHAKAKQLKHWEVIASGTFDDTYVASVTRIGKTHERLGLEPRWYIAGYSLLLGRLQHMIEVHYKVPWFGARAAAMRAKKARLLAAVTSAALLDMDFAISVYLEFGLKTKQDTIDRMSMSFRSIVDDLSDESSRLEKTASTLTRTASTTQHLSASVASASEETSANVQSVASATEELASSVTEIARQVETANRIAGDAVTKAGETGGVIAGLAGAAERIGEVIGLINAIAAQTNLLALNATIEAARAGEAGKGFAVVAQEVKALAAQTAKATGDISTQIAAMQSATASSVSAIKDIGGIIARISEVSSAIAAAVEQQGAATQEIARNLQEAAAGTTHVTDKITSVNAHATETGEASTDVLSTAAALSQDSARLKDEVERFFATVCAAG
jgi:methyl-accepting chemotaxis protein